MCLSLESGRGPRACTRRSVFSAAALFVLRRPPSKSQTTSTEQLPHPFLLWRLIGPGPVLQDAVRGCPPPSAVRDAQGDRARLSRIHQRRCTSSSPFPRGRGCRCRADLPPLRLSSSIQVFDYIFAEAVRTSNKPLLQSRQKWVRVHTSTSHVHALVEALRSPEVSRVPDCSTCPL